MTLLLGMVCLTTQVAPVFGQNATSTAGGYSGNTLLLRCLHANLCSLATLYLTTGLRLWGIWENVSDLFVDNPSAVARLKMS